MFVYMKEEFKTSIQVAKSTFIVHLNKRGKTTVTVE
jgi:hypothetical protein